MIRKGLLYFMGFLLVGHVFALRITNMNMRYDISHWTLTFDSDSRPAVKLFALDKPHRIVVDFHQVSKRPASVMEVERFSYTYIKYKNIVV